MAGITYYERARRKYGEGAIAMIHHVYNKWNGYAFHSELTMQTMEEFIDMMGEAKNYVPIRTYYIPLKEFPQEWERAQYVAAQVDEPQKQKIMDFVREKY